MNEVLVIMPVEYDKDSGCVNDVFGELVCEPADPLGKGVDKVGRFIAKALNEHTALLAVAEAAEAYFLAAKDLPLGITVSVGEWTAQHNAKQELSAKLAAWRKG